MNTFDLGCPLSNSKKADVQDAMQSAPPMCFISKAICLIGRTGQGRLSMPARGKRYERTRRAGKGL